jgi:hypothetical protein
MSLFQVRNSSNPPCGSTLPPGSSLDSNSLLQFPSSAHPSAFESHSNTDSFPSELPCTHCLLRNIPNSPDVIFSDMNFPDESEPQGPKGIDSPNQKEGAVVPKMPPTPTPYCICDERSWLDQCPRLWDHVWDHHRGFVPAFTPGSCTCPGTAFNHLVPRSCPVAAWHLVEMVRRSLLPS